MFIYSARCPTCRIKHTAVVTINSSADPANAIKVVCKHGDSELTTHKVSLNLQL